MANFFYSDPKIAMALRAISRSRLVFGAIAEMDAGSERGSEGGSEGGSEADSEGGSEGGTGKGRRVRCGRVRLSCQGNSCQRYVAGARGSCLHSEVRERARAESEGWVVVTAEDEELMLGVFDVDQSANVCQRESVCVLCECGGYECGCGCGCGRV
jgi:hypothetical protein